MIVIGMVAFSLAWVPSHSVPSEQETGACIARGTGAPFQEQSWNKVQYLGGAIDVPSIPRYWKNTLTISCGSIRLKTGTNQLVEFTPEQVTAIAYAGQKGDNAAAGKAGFAAGGLLGLLIASQVKSVSHFIGIEFRLPDGRPSGLLLRADKKNYDAILNALGSVTKLGGPPAPGGKVH